MNKPLTSPEIIKVFRDKYKAEEMRGAIRHLEAQSYLTAAQLQTLSYLRKAAKASK
jgi:hypothetical protein